MNQEKNKCPGNRQYEKKSGEKIAETHENNSPFCKDHLQEKNNRSFLAEHSKKHAIAYRKTVSECYGCFSFVKSMIV